MSEELRQQDWNERINACLERIITGSWVEYQYVANPADPRLDYHKKVVRDIYLRRAQMGDFNIESILEDILDHDESQLETASSFLLMQSASCQECYSSHTYEDLLFQLKLDLAEESGFIFFSDYASPMDNDDLPLFVICTLAEMHAYFETAMPPKYGVQTSGFVPRTFGQFDAQNVLFDKMVEYDHVLCVQQSRTITSPLLCRLDRSRLPIQKTLKGVVSYVNE